MAEMYEMPREMCEMPRADSPDAVYAEVTPVGEPEAASQGEKTGKSSRLKLLLVALLVINFIFTGVCFYMVMEMKLGIVNYERQIGELKSKQIGNATTEPRPIDGPAGIMGETGTQGPKGKNANVGSYGITGLNGTDERDGIKGKCGMKGEKGQKGLPGQSGKDGRIGPRGDTGSMGIKGQKGDIGPTGLRGETGQKGNPGNTPPKGNKGEVGSTGPIGPKGKTGAIGQKGLKGNIGNVGNTGAKGTKGQKGESDVATLQRRIQELQRVRLVNGGSYYGRVEVFHNGIWGTVCDDDWDTNDAAVFCRMMGFKGANAAPGSANYGQGSGQIWLDDVNCGGSEINIDDCSKNSWGSQNCDHSEDAGVTCIH